MSKMKKSLHFVTALTLGATMLSPMDNAWGMMGAMDEQGAPCSHIQQRTTSVPGLVGDVLVTDELRLGAGAILQNLESGMDRTKIKNTKDFLGYLLNIKNYGVERVMALIKQSHSPSVIKTDDCITRALVMIRDAQPDPYFDLLTGPILTMPSDRTAEQRIKSIKNRAAVENLFEQEFPHLSKNFIDSFLARLPKRDQMQIEQIYAKAFEDYFDLSTKEPAPIKKGRKETPASWKKRQDARSLEVQKLQRMRETQREAAQLAYKTKLDEAVSMYATLIELEAVAVLQEEAAKLEPSSSSAPLGSSDLTQLHILVDPDLSVTDTSAGNSVLDSVTIEEVTPPPFTFNNAFVGASVGIPSGYKFVIDPVQEGRNWGVRSLVSKGDGHVAAEGDGYVFYYQIPTAEMKLLHGKRFRFEVDVLSNAPGAYAQYWGYLNASSEKIKSEVHPGDGSWKRLSLDFTADENNTLHYIYPVILPAISEGSDIPVVEVKNVRVKEL
ncbi:MAG: hypothetical protein K2P93_00705 [Alphaproteobacteria bacterium]|nr:hypothetical protein [Alphaproteobacteria bacterium]